MPPQSLLQRFRRLDAYAQNKILDEFRVKSPIGGLVTVVSFITILFLVLMELTRYLTPVMQPEIVVDGGKAEKMPISFNITFPHVPCYMIGLDIMDESGTVVTEYEHDVYKVRLDAQGRQIHIEKTKELGHSDVPQPTGNIECGDCYGAKSPNEDGCCNTCDDVRKAYSDMGWMVREDQIAQCVRERMGSSQEGCNMHGTILMNRVQGNFHFSPGKAVSYGSQHIHDVRTYLASDYDFQHEIHHLWFGDQKEYTTQLQKRTQAQGLTNPLDNTRFGMQDHHRRAPFMYQYFLKIVPTQFSFLNGNSARTYQYSTTFNERDLSKQSAGGLPGVFFNMNFSPMLIVYTETHPSLASFLTNICAIIGGIFTVASVVDGILFRASIRQRQAMGKSA